MAVFPKHHVEAIAKVVRTSDLSQANKIHIASRFVEMLKTYNYIFDERKFRDMCGDNDLSSFFDRRVARGKVRNPSDADSN